MTPEIFAWATRHSISAAAMLDLRALFGIDMAHLMPEAAQGATSEAAVQAVLRLEASRKGVRLFRNNVGVVTDETSIGMRFGLANDNPTLNGVLKSADLIGWRPVLIGPHHVGTMMAQTVSREAKPVGWKYRGTDREVAQLNWAKMLVADGGDAAFATGEGTL